MKRKTSRNTLPKSTRNRSSRPASAKPAERAIHHQIESDNADCIIPPRATRSQRQIVTELDPGNLITDGHALELVVDLDAIQIFRRPDGRYLVDFECVAQVPDNVLGHYSVPRRREVMSQAETLQRLLFSVAPREFWDLLMPTFDRLDALESCKSAVEQE